MDKASFQEELLQIMEKKSHWAWPSFTDGTVSKDTLHIHLEQEYEVYIRDFPVLIGKAYVQCPIAEVRQELAENLYEEETGGLHAGRPHPQLFLLYPEGLGMDLSRFESITLLPAAQRYRDYLHHACGGSGWEVGTAISTIFVEGTRFDRSVVDSNAEPRPAPPLEDHPLVRHYGLDISFLALTKAHRGVEGDHRISAWRCVLDHVTPEKREEVVLRTQEALNLWKLYRDDVATACGLKR